LVSGFRNENSNCRTIYVETRLLPGIAGYDAAKIIYRFGILNFCHCNLFDICDLEFPINLVPPIGESSMGLDSLFVNGNG
jgi:hypothetical protein